MKALPSSSMILTLTTLYVGLFDTSAFSPGGRIRTKPPRSTSQTSSFLIGNKKPSHRQEVTTLHAAEESAAAAQAAFMSAAPLLLAPLAALAYGSQALNAKEQLELDLVATEIRLEDIKEKTRRTQLQATVRIFILQDLCILGFHSLLFQPVSKVFLCLGFSIGWVGGSQYLWRYCNKAWSEQQQFL